MRIRMIGTSVRKENQKFKDELYKQFLSSSNLPTPEDKKNVLINLLNGTFEITEHKQELREERKEDFIKYQLPFEFNPSANYPLFDIYLKRVLPDTDCQKVLAEYLGYIFVNNLKLEKALILYGNGVNGKSVFFEIVNAMLIEELIRPKPVEPKEPDVLQDMINRNPVLELLVERLGLVRG